MRVEQLRDLTVEELDQRLHDLEEELFNMRLRRPLDPLQNPLKLRTTRRDIARVKTVMSEVRRGIHVAASEKKKILDD